VWAANHFSTWVRKTDADRKWIEHEAFSRRGISPFYDLLVTSATSPAMVVYLDQGASYAGRINENYAREIMELHTVGVRGGYSQADVTALAKLLTGWTTAKLGDGDGRVQNEVREYEFRFEPMLNDAAPKQVFGMDLGSANPGERYDRITAMLESLASHPATAKFISQKLAEHYISRPAPDSVVDKMAETFASTNGNLAAVIRTCISSAEFWSSDPRLAKPLEYSMRLYRAANRQEPGGISGYLRRSRAGLFDHPTPEGLPEQDIAYGDSNAMIQRWKLARDVAGGLASAVPNSLRYNNQPLDEATSQRALDLIAIRLTGRLLGAESNTAALKVITESEGTRDERIREAAILIAQLPEGNLR